MAPACSFRLQAESLQAELPRFAGILVLVLLLGGCGAATYGTRDDATIATRVKIALLNDPRVGPQRLDARAANGVVTLSGTVASQADVDAAIAAARKVAGARDVRSELKIVP